MLRTYLLMLLALALITGCQTKEEESKETQQNGLIQFNNARTNQSINLTIKRQESSPYPLKIQIYDKANKAIDKIVLLLAFPPDCNVCLPMLTHLNNLGSRIESLQIIVLATEHINAKLYHDLLGTQEPNFWLLISNEALIFDLLDSIKRGLNIEIRDSKSPFLLLLDKQAQIIQSYEGPILEEILDSDILLLIDSYTNKE